MLSLSSRFFPSGFSVTFCAFILVCDAACGISGPVDNDKPVITLNGSNSITLLQYAGYVETGATAIDNSGGNINLTITGSVDTDTPGSYTITYSATDKADNTGTATRTVHVVKANPDLFITTWKTDNPGVTADNQIKISTVGGGYNYTVDWGDGVKDNNLNGDVTHTYAVAGTYTVTISGDFPRMYSYSGSTDAEKLLAVKQWGNIQWRSMSSAFAFCVNLVIEATDAPDLFLVTDMSGMFESAHSFNQDLNSWDVSSVSNMSRMFYRARSFNQDLSSWDVSSVTNMSGMFQEAIAFNQDISAWNVISVVDMSWMFAYAEAFNRNPGPWNVSSVTDMRSMFEGARNFNQDISEWDVSSVTNFNGMFQDANAFKQDISAWDVSAVTDMGNMFKSALAFNQNLASWDVSSVTNMRGMFSSATLSTANYDAMLAGWSAQNLQNGVKFDGGNSQYSSSLQSARDALTNFFDWTVIDGGIAPR